MSNPVLVEPATDNRAVNKRRARSKSRPRALYAAEPEMVRSGSGKCEGWFRTFSEEQNLYGPPTI